MILSTQQSSSGWLASIVNSVQYMGVVCVVIHVVQYSACCMCVYGVQVCVLHVAVCLCIYVNMYMYMYICIYHYSVLTNSCM